MILACTHFGNIDDEPVLLYFDGLCDLGKKNRRNNMGRKQTPPFCHGPLSTLTQPNQWNFLPQYMHKCTNYIPRMNQFYINYPYVPLWQHQFFFKKKTTHAHFRQRGGVCRVRAEHSHLVHGESILERSIVSANFHCKQLTHLLLNSPKTLNCGVLSCTRCQMP